jgi:hypothetical protein
MSIFPSKVTYTTGQVLTATEMNEIGQAINLLDGAQTSGAKNRVLNSNFSVWQRGTTGAGSGTAFVADRWQAYRGAAGSTFSRQVTNDTTNLPFIQYCIRAQRDSGNTSTSPYSNGQNFESVNSIPLAGKTVVLSFYARAGANYSPTSKALNSRVWTGTGTDQAIQGTYTGAAFTIQNTATLTTTWQRFSYTGTIPAASTEMAIQFYCSPTGTAGAADYFEVTGVQIELGSVATTFSRAGGTIQGELAACQRYYWRSASATAYAYLGNGQATSTGSTSILVNNPVPLRVTALTVDYSNLGITDAISIQSAVTGITIAQANTLVNAISATGLAGLTTYRPYFLSNQNNVAGYIGFGAEL